MTLTIMGSRNCNLDARGKIDSVLSDHQREKDKQLVKVLHELWGFGGEYLALSKRGDLTRLYSTLSEDIPIMKFEARPVSLGYDFGHEGFTDMDVAWFLGWEEYRPAWDHFYSAFCDIYKDVIHIVNRNSTRGRHTVTAPWTDWGAKETQGFKDRGLPGLVSARHVSPGQE